MHCVAGGSKVASEAALFPSKKQQRRKDRYRSKRGGETAPSREKERMWIQNIKRRQAAYISQRRGANQQWSPARDVKKAKDVHVCKPIKKGSPQKKGGGLYLKTSSDTSSKEGGRKFVYIGKKKQSFKDFRPPRAKGGHRKKEKKGTFFIVAKKNERLTS